MTIISQSFVLTFPEDINIPKNIMTKFKKGQIYEF